MLNFADVAVFHGIPPLAAEPTQSVGDDPLSIGHDGGQDPIGVLGEASDGQVDGDSMIEMNRLDDEDDVDRVEVAAEGHSRGRNTVINASTAFDCEAVSIKTEEQDNDSEERHHQTHHHSHGGQPDTAVVDLDFVQINGGAGELSPVLTTAFEETDNPLDME